MARGLSNLQDGVLVSTVDAFQGGERDIIILSTVRCKQDAPTVFLDDARRMNVALSRAKRHLWIIGSEQPLNKSQRWRWVMNYCRAKFW